MLEIFLEIIILLLAIPVGILISRLTKDEFSDGKKYFLSVLILSIIFSLFFFVINKQAVHLSLNFVVIVSGISYFAAYKNLNNSKSKK